LSGDTRAFIALAPGTARAGRTRAAPAARFYVCSLLKIRAIRPIARTPSADGLGAAPVRRAIEPAPARGFVRCLRGIVCHDRH